MARPLKLRRVTCNAQAMRFRPCSAQKSDSEVVSLNLDEVEAIRLADYDGLYQEQAAEKMKISRQTFGNIIESAHKKVADFLLNSKFLTIGGGMVEIDRCRFVCSTCQHTWAIACGKDRPQQCPKCNSTDFNCVKKVHEGKTFKKCWRDL